MLKDLLLLLPDPVTAILLVVFKFKEGAPDAMEPTSEADEAPPA